jgi:hypothetical protein
VAAIVVALAAAPAHAANVSMIPVDPSAPLFTGAVVLLRGAPDEQVNALVLGTDAGSSLMPATLLITDLSGTLTSHPSTGEVPCTIVTPMIARCHLDSFWIQSFHATLGARDDRLVATSLSAQPLWYVDSGAGNDVVVAPMSSPNEGSANTATIDGGPGNDTIVVGPQLLSPAPLEGYGMQVLGGPGNDLMETVNGSTDFIDCGPGTDTLLADRGDTPPRPDIDPSTHCETRGP